MKLHKIAMILLLLVFSLAVVNATADKPLERLGNEAAAEGDDLYSEDEFLQAAAKYEEAYEFFKRAEVEDGIPLQDKINQMLANMVTSYYHGQDYANAVRILKIRLDNDPANAVLARQIAQIYERDMNEVDNAISTLENFDARVANFDVRRTLGRLYAAKNNDAKTLEWYEKAFELRQDPDILQNIALLHHRTGNPQMAIQAYEDFLETEPRETVLINVYRNMGRFYEDIENESKAIEYYERSNRLRFNRDITLLLLTKYYDRGDYLNANEKINQLLRDNPNHSDAIFYKGLILFDQEKYSEAKAEFEKIRTDRRYGANARQYIDSIESM
jgi:tetratricopeptide (TPR) repeat protein